MLATLLTPTAGEATVAGADLRREPQQVRRADRLRPAGRLDRSGRDRPRRARHPGPPLRHEQGRRPGARRGGARRARPRGGRRPDDEHLLGRHERRLDVGLGIVHRPSVLFLDEPTTGLDPQARARMWDEIRGLRDAGHDRLPDDPLPRGGRRAGRPAGDHRPRPDRRRGHGRRAQAPGRRRRRDARRRRRRPNVSSTPCARPAVRPRGDRRGRASSGSTSTTARRPSRSSSASSTAPGWRPRRSPSIAPASTTSSSARPAARCARSRGMSADPRHRTHDHEEPTT